jgi:hypothetical protein
MKKQKIALVAIGVVGLVLMGTALLSVARGNNNTPSGIGNTFTQGFLATDNGNTLTMEYMSAPKMSIHECFSGNDILNGWQNGNQINDGENGKARLHGRMKGPQRNGPPGTHFKGGNYLNITRIEGVLGYNEDMYMVGTTVLYLGNELFLKNLAQSDYDQDGTYEYIWQELEGLMDTPIVVNGILENNTLYVTHINGIWLRIPTNRDITEIQGELTYDNETSSYFVGDTGIVIKKRGFSRSDIDGDESLEPLWEELKGLVGETITVDGTLYDEVLVIEHINGIWVM